MMNQSDLQEFTSAAAETLAVPGVAVALMQDDETLVAFHGVTSLENPLPVDGATLFQIGSVGKTFTATAILRLADVGLVDIEAPVRTYVPELRLQDETVASSVTVLQLLNHTAGWEGDLFADTGGGDDALARLVDRMADIEQVTPLGSTVSYNNASLALAGRLVEKVLGTTYERAVADLIFKPLGLENSFFFATDIMTRRFVAGHKQLSDGTVQVARPWALPRSGNPAGGISCTVGDLLTWARFHLADGRAATGQRLLSKELLRSMLNPTVSVPGNALGDHVGISWFLRDVDGLRLVSHSGTTNGQHADLTLVPERNFAIAILANCGPNGPELIEQVRRWVLESCLAVMDRDPEPLALSEEELAPYVGTYENRGASCAVFVEDGCLKLKYEFKPELLARLNESGEAPSDEFPVATLGMLPSEGDRYVVMDGPAKGMKGYFTRGDDGTVTAAHVAGRLSERT